MTGQRLDIALGEELADELSWMLLEGWQKSGQRSALRRQVKAEVTYQDGTETIHVSPPSAFYQKDTDGMCDLHVKVDLPPRLQANHWKLTGQASSVRLRMGEDWPGNISSFALRSTKTKPSATTAVGRFVLRPLDEGG